MLSHAPGRWQWRLNRAFAMLAHSQLELVDVATEESMQVALDKGPRPRLTKDDMEGPLERQIRL